MSDPTPAKSPDKTNLSGSDQRATLRDLRRWVKDGSPFAVLTCYDATTARWLDRGGLRVMLVGDTAAQMILGHDSTLPAPMDFMVRITAAVRRGAPKALVIADMPFGSYQCGEDEAVRNAGRFLTEGGADLVKLEVDRSFTPLVRRLAHAGIPVMPHIGSRPQTVRASGGFRAAGRTAGEADMLADLADELAGAGASALLVEAVPDEVGRRIVEAAAGPAGGGAVPVIGCGAGPACHGHVVVLHDLLGLTDWQPPFATPMAEFGPRLAEAAKSWVDHVGKGQYLKDGGPYTTKPARHEP